MGFGDMRIQMEGNELELVNILRILNVFFTLPRLYCSNVPYHVKYKVTHALIMSQVSQIIITYRRMSTT